MSIQNDLLVDALFPAHQRTKMMMKARKAVVPKYTERTVSGNPAVLTNTTAGLPLTGLKLNGKSTQESTTGAQLLPLVDREPETLGGLTWQTKDGVVSVEGTCTASGASNDYYFVGASAKYEDAGFPVGTIAVTTQNMPANMTLYIVRQGGNVLLGISGSKNFATFSHVDGNTYRIMLRGTTGKDFNAQNITIMFNAGNKAIPWEPYTGGIQSPNPDYPQEIKSVGDSGKIPVTIHNDAESQDVNIQTPNGLLGIPVDSGGNLTDSSGQQWICDEIDFTRKVYVQRCVKLVLNGTEYWKAEMSGGVQRYLYTTPYQFSNYTRRKALMSHFYFLESGSKKGGGFVYVKNIFLYPVAAGETMSVEDFTAWLKENPVTVVAPLYKPVEIPLTDEQIQAFESMSTYDGTTTVETQEDVSYMEVGYKIQIPKPSSNEVLGRWFKQHPLI